MGYSPWLSAIGYHIQFIAGEGDSLSRHIVGRLSEAALFYKRINCRIRGGEGFLIAITPEDASLQAGEDRWAHATIELARDDWLRSLSGQCNLRSISMAGRFACDMEQLKVVSVFGMILQSFALLNRG